MRSSRLKNFCQLCRKQCKDDNGYKCHLNSTSHQLRVRQYATNPIEHIEKASQQFEKKFVQMIKLKYPGQPKYLQQLFEQLTEEKKFLKFNHTQWKTLTQFGEHLKGVRNVKVIGNPPLCKIVYMVNKTNTFIESMKKDKVEQVKERQKEHLQSNIIKRMRQQKQRQQKQEEKLNKKIEQEELQRHGMVIPEKLQLNFNFQTDNKRQALFTTEEIEKEVQAQSTSLIHPKKVSNIEKVYQKLLKEEAKQKKIQEEEEQQQVDWVMPDIIVKIKPHEIDEAFHNKKCKITKKIEPFICEVQIGTAKIQIDQTYLQTVIPKINHKIMVLIGQDKGKLGILKSVNIEDGYGEVELSQGEKKKFSFSFISKVFENQ